MEIALKNNKVMRNIGGSVQGPPDFILRNPEAAPTIYDPAIAESSPRGGVEGAGRLRREVQHQPDLGADEHAGERQPGVCPRRHFRGYIGTRPGYVPSPVVEGGGHGRPIQFDEHGRQRFGPVPVWRPGAVRLRSGLERQARGRGPPAVAARGRNPVQPHRRPWRAGRAVQRRDDRADQHRHRAGQLRGGRAEPGQRRGNRLLGAVFRVPLAGRRDCRPRQRLDDLAEDLHVVPRSAARAARPKRRPRPAPSTSSSAARPKTRSIRSTSPKPSSATCWDWRRPTGG